MNDDMQISKEKTTPIDCWKCGEPNPFILGFVLDYHKMVQCRKCQNQTTPCFNEEDAIDLWNKKITLNRKDRRTK